MDRLYCKSDGAYETFHSIVGNRNIHVLSEQGYLWLYYSKCNKFYYLNTKGWLHTLDVVKHVDKRNGKVSYKVADYILRRNNTFAFNYNWGTYDKEQDAYSMIISRLRQDDKLNIQYIYNYYH
jgi:hypothetical protein